MKTLAQWFDEYAVSHKTNKKNITSVSLHLFFGRCL
jgi:hypothetical protein